MLTSECILTDGLVSLFGHRVLDMKLFRGKELLNRRTARHNHRVGSLLLVAHS